MPATKISDLLPIAPGTRKPHPYQVLGLEDGEQDAKVIARATKQAISKLKAAKPQADEKTWRRAALLVKQAQEVLSSPERKAKLDARFGIVSTESISDSPSSASDPLAAILPAVDPIQTQPADPLAAVLPSTNPLAPAALGAEAAGPASDRTHGEPARTEPPEHSPSTFKLPTAEAVSAEAASAEAVWAESDGDRATRDSTVGINAPAPVVVKPKKKKRKRSSTGVFLLGTFAVGCLAVVCGLV